MKSPRPNRPHAALRGGPRVGAGVRVRLAVNSMTAFRHSSRFGGLPVPI